MIITGSRNRKTNLIYNKVYQTWRSMMYRCYKPSCPAYKNYGAKGVIVCEKWRSLDGFIDDIDKVMGFDLQKFIDGEISLDKDKIGNSKEYSIDCCCWISKSENNKYKPNQQIKVTAISPDGELYTFSNQSEFAREHNLSQGRISDCICGKIKSHKGWKFYK